MIPNSSACTEKQADAFYVVGHWLLEQCRYEDAKHVFRTMLLVAPADERGWVALGMSHESVNELEIAANLYDLARKACPGSVRARIALARALRQSGRDVEANDVIVEALEIASESDDTELAALAKQEVVS